MSITVEKAVDKFHKKMAKLGISVDSIELNSETLEGNILLTEFAEKLEASDHSAKLSDENADKNPKDIYANLSQVLQDCLRGNDFFSEQSKMGCDEPSTTAKENKYAHTIVGLDGTKTIVDAYRIQAAFPNAPEIDHAIKKLLVPGNRHDKSELKDLEEAVWSINRRISFIKQTNDETA